MVTAKRILVPVDFSESSRKAVAYGVAIAQRTGATLYLAHILAAVPAFGYTLSDNPLDIDAERLANARQTLLDLLPANRDELHYELIAKIGVVEEELVSAVRGENINLVIMGSRGKTRLRRFLLGSVAEHLIRRLDVPVLTVSHLTPDHDLTAGSAPGISRILFATALGAGVENGIAVSAELARRFGAALTVAHVVPRPPFGEAAPPVTGEFLFSDDSSAIAAQLHELTRPYLKEVKVHTAILRGEPADAILHFADQDSVDLVVLNLERKTVLERVLLGTTAEKVVRLAHMPVLSIPVDLSSETARTVA
jgi:nucleotide-binding universal stress UspA family protein